MSHNNKNELDRTNKGTKLQSDVPLEISDGSLSESPEEACTQPRKPIRKASHSAHQAQDRVSKRDGRKGSRRSAWKAREPSASSSYEQNRPAPLERSGSKGPDSTAENITAGVEDAIHCAPLAEHRGILREAVETGDNVASSSRNKESEKEEVIMKRFLELELSANEHTMSEPDQELNKQEQSDEMVALQAILGEDFAVLEANEGSSQTYMISIHVEISTNLNVFVKLPSYLNSSQNSIPGVHLPEGSASSRNSDSNAGRTVGKLHVCTVEFLPPIHLIYRLPKSYPSHSPPTFVLSARWLTQGMLSSLCQGLDTLWEQQTGEVVIYSWAEWLRSSCLLHLGITDQLDLDICETGVQDIRALSCFCIGDVDIPWLIHYNEEQKNREFVMALHTCFICFTEQLGKNFVRLPCKHNFCYECMTSYAKIHVKEGSVKKLHCPDTSCKSVIPPTILKQLLEEDEFNRWERLLLQKTLDSMVDIVYCPRCEVMCIEDEDHHAQCSGCFFSFCSLCKGARHVGQDCMSAETRLRLLQERQEASKFDKDRSKEQDILNEFLSMKYMQQETKQCPACKMAISKVEGCNKVTCGNCGQYFCYQCNKAIEGYDHFREGCILFDQSEIERWEYQMNVLQGDGGHGLWLPCPNCRQRNLKIQNNNHIFCLACQNHYCALCKRMVRRSSEHYGVGPNKCRQHTLD